MANTGSDPGHHIFAKLQEFPFDFCGRNFWIKFLSKNLEISFKKLKKTKMIFLKKKKQKNKTNKIDQQKLDLILLNQSCTNIFFWRMNGFLITALNPDKDSFWELVIKFYKLWPPFQWATSLLTLILIYWVTGYYYNKFLSQRSGWMGIKTRIIMIIFDLALNFALGIYYMKYRDTFIGTLMSQCPVFCSPIFWLLELICFYFYCRYHRIKKKI